MYGAEMLPNIVRSMTWTKEDGLNIKAFTEEEIRLLLNEVLTYRDKIS